MPDRVQALQRSVVGVIGGFACGARPLDEGVTEAFTDFLLLLVQDLLWHFLPKEAEVADRGYQSLPNGFPGRKQQRALVAVMIVACQKLIGWLMRQVTGRKHVRKIGFELSRPFSTLRQVRFQKSA